MTQPQEPAAKRVIALFDGQNLFYSAREAFGYTEPNYDVKKLAGAVAAEQGWTLLETRFYSGFPDATDDLRWHQYWIKKFAQMGRVGVRTHKKILLHRDRMITCPHGHTFQHHYRVEKGIDVRIAVDMIRLAFLRACDVILVFSQDQDLAEAAEEARDIAEQQKRWLTIASAYPSSPAYQNSRGINLTDWLPFQKGLYDQCIDTRNYW